MAEVCRDCRICTLPGIQRWIRSWGSFLLTLCTGGIYRLYVKGFRKNCPKCGHKMSDHKQRADGSFAD